jgi:archaellum component FlaF (FlaF/FlaG flagellin family)
VSVATLVALFGLLYTIYRNSYVDMQKSIEQFELRMQEVIKQQNAAIEELRKRRR